MAYNPKSLHAEEFISDEEIRETLRYAEENKNNVELIDAILEKARPRVTEKGTTCAGSLTGKRRYCSAAKYPKKSRKCTPWPKKSKRPFTATAL